MSLGGNVGITTSEDAIFLKNAHMSLEGNIGGYTSETTSGQMPITSETPSSVEESSGCNISEAISGQIMPITSETPSSVEGSSGCSISEATSGQNAHNIRDTIERGGEQRTENSKRFFCAYAHATIRGDSNPTSVGDISQC